MIVVRMAKPAWDGGALFSGLGHAALSPGLNQGQPSKQYGYAMDQTETAG
jgi:hypothetical protein